MNWPFWVAAVSWVAFVVWRTRTLVTLEERWRTCLGEYQTRIVEIQNREREVREELWNFQGTGAVVIDPQSRVGEIRDLAYRLTVIESVVLCPVVNTDGARCALGVNHRGRHLGPYVLTSGGRTASLWDAPKDAGKESNA